MLCLRQLHVGVVLAALVCSVVVSGHPSQPPPVAELFGVGVFSTGDYELPPTFTSDGMTAYFTVSTPVYGRMRVIVETHRRNGGWTLPVVAPFSGQYDDADPYLSPDQTQLFFLSKRPAPGGAPRRDLDIWVMHRSATGWRPPTHLGATVNGPGDEHYVTATRQGTLYISAVRPDSQGSGDLYRVRSRGDGYHEPENLGPTVNSAGVHDTTPFVDPDERYMIFAFRRPDSLGDLDLYVSIRDAGGDWTTPRNLGPSVNSGATEFCPIVSPDGEYLYFTSTRHLFDAPLAQALTSADLWRQLRGPGNMLGDTYRVRIAPLLTHITTVQDAGVRPR